MQRQTQTMYRHTQEGPWAWLLGAIGAGLCATAWTVRQEPVALILCGSIGALMILLAAMFRELTVADEGDCLAVGFGPLPGFRTTIPYDDIVSAEPGQTLILDGWGIHMSVRGGWVWNIWGRDCVVIRRSKGVIRIGTDEPDALADFLRQRIGKAGHH